MGIRCSSCGYDNDPTRVYCHSCGIKLERGNSSAPPPTGFTHPTDVSKMKRPRQPISWGKYFGFALRLCVLAALAAAGVMAVLPPRNVPAALEADEGLAERLTALLGDAASAGSPRAFAVPANDVQQWLVTVVRFAEPVSAVGLTPRRIYSEQGEGFIRVGMETSFLDAVDLYFEGDYVPVADGAGYTLRPFRYSVGRLPLPVALGWPVERQFKGLREALAAPLTQLARASYIGVAPEAVTLRWAGTQSP